MTNYDTIPQILDKEEPAVCQTSTTTAKQILGSNGPSKLMIGGALTFLVFLAVRYSTGTGDVATAESTMMLPQHLKGKSSSTMACSFEDCYASKCNQKVAPFTCLIHNGGPHGGCSATPWVAGSCERLPLCCFFVRIMNDIHELTHSLFLFYFFFFLGTKSCDLSHCAGLDIPKDTDSCDKPCKKEVCTADRLCNADAPYQCTSGAATFGCSVGKLEWTLNTSSQTCSSCCDATTCKEI